MALREGMTHSQFCSHLLSQNVLDPAHVPCLTEPEHCVAQHRYTVELARESKRYKDEAALRRAAAERLSHIGA